MTMTEKYKILTQFIKDISGETPDIETYLFVKENKERIKNMRVIIYEQDGVPWSDMIPKYEELDDILESMNFKRVFSVPHPKYENNPHFHNVWVKDVKT